MWKLALKSVWARKVKLGLLGAIVMTSVGFITGTFMFTDTISKGFGDLFGTVYKDTAAVVRGQKVASDADSFDSGARNLVPKSVLAKVGTAPGVATANGVIQIFMSVLDKNTNKPIEIGPPTFGRNWFDSRGGNWGIGDEGWSYAVGNCGDGVESKLCAVDPAGNASSVAVARGTTFKSMHTVTNGRATWAMLDGKLAWLSRGAVMFPAGAAPKGFTLVAVDAEGQPIGIAEGHATRWSRDGKWRAIFGH